MLCPQITLFFIQTLNLKENQNTIKQMHDTMKLTSAKSSALSRVYVAGLSTTVLPIASAGATFHVSSIKGKFQGTIAPTTPEK